MKVHSNGSHWYGESPDDIPTLLGVLATHPLRSDFEDYGNFVIESDEVLPPGIVRVWGNFEDRSHVFQIDGTREELAEVIAAIRANQATPAYQAARADRLESERKSREIAEKKERDRRAKIDPEVAAEIRRAAADAERCLHAEACAILGTDRK